MSTTPTVKSDYKTLDDACHALWQSYKERLGTTYQSEGGTDPWSGYEAEENALIVAHGWTPDEYNAGLTAQDKERSWDAVDRLWMEL